MTAPVVRVCVAMTLAILVACSAKEPPPAATADAPAVGPPEPAAERLSVESGAAPSAVHNDPAVIHYEGFGPAKFGASEEAVRMAWGYPLESSLGAEGSSCRYLAMDPPPEGGRGIWFMIEDGKFVRYDVDVPMHVAPGNLVVGSPADEVRAAHAGRIEEQPHKYVEGGKVLVVSPPDGGASRLVFEIDAAGKVMNWRIGVPPQVQYVEGCG